jgi:hypothetical protein
MKCLTKCFVLALLLCSFAVAKDPLPAVCGPENASFKINRSTALPPTPVPENGKALVYVFGFGKYAVDGKPLGEINQSYSFFQLDPGEHHVCAQYSNWMNGRFFSLHSLDAKTGETYYLEISFPPYGRFTLSVMDPDEARGRMSKFPFSTSQPK